jgi:hypothetical protein
MPRENSLSIGEVAAKAQQRGPARRAFGALVATSAVLLAIRLYAARRVGFGDSEALYAAYALHPQPAYLDHPGLVGVVARTIGGGTAPSAEQAHTVTSVAATLVPLALALACRASGASWRRAFVTASVVALVPEVSIGLFAMTPDLLIALAWTGAIAFAAMGMLSLPGSVVAALAFGAAGVLAGTAAASKATGILLLVALGIAYATPACRPHGRTFVPWAGLAAGALAFAPALLFEAHHGWPMVRHRLVDTQHSAGFSFRNAGALVGGQLVYLSPLVAAMAVRAGRDLWRERTDAVGSLLFVCCVVPLAALVPLCLWSRVAEPHWIAPALLALAPAAARADRVPSRRLVGASCALAASMTAAVYAWVLTPSLLRLAPHSYDAGLDLANELYGWPEVLRAVREEALGEWAPGSERGDVVIAGPHWVICAQLDAALRGEVPVGCDTPERDDFDDWWPRTRWRRAEAVVWVSDARFGPPPSLPAHAVVRMRDIRIFRGGRLVRVFAVAVLARRAAA